MLPESQHQMRVPLGDGIHPVRRLRASPRHDETAKDEEKQYPAH
jgi:hypothetical protein